MKLGIVFSFVVIAGLGGVALAKPKIAILGLEDTKPTKSTIAKDLTTGLRNQANAGGRYSLAPQSDVTLVAAKASHDCKAEALACMAAIGADLGADVLLYGKTEKTAQGNVAITLKVLDVARKQFKQEYTGSVVGDATAKEADDAAKTAYLALTQ